MKKLLTALVLGAFSFGFAQESVADKPESTSKMYVKANAAFIPVGIINAGVEYQLAPKYTFQADVFASPWKSFSGHELQYYMLGLEGRYYFDEAFKHWYVGANIGFSTYKVQKWNYWNDEFYKDAQQEQVSSYINSNIYQKGYSFLIGATIGYQFKINENWNVDIYAGGGHSEDRYKAYDRVSGNRVDSAE
jgi:hypothetical protein